MKKLFFYILITSVLVSCIKQKDCDCGFSGTWQYLEQPYSTNVNGAEKKVVAVISETNYTTELKIIGNVPKQFTTLLPIRVNFCVDAVEGMGHKTGGHGIYKLKCIETIN
jgi:hypothetical protein